MAGPECGLAEEGLECIYGVSTLCSVQKQGSGFSFHCEAIKVSRIKTQPPSMGELDCFQSFAVANNAVIEILVYHFACALISPGCISRNRRAGAKALGICNFNTYYQIAFLGDDNN